MKTELKYKFKDEIVKMFLKLLSIEDSHFLMCCTNQVALYFESLVYDEIIKEDDKDQQLEILNRLQKFGNYISINILYDLVVKERKNFNIYKTYNMSSKIEESLNDAKIPDNYLKHISQVVLDDDRIFLDGSIYYDYCVDNENTFKDIKKLNMKIHNNMINLYQTK